MSLEEVRVPDGLAEYAFRPVSTRLAKAVGTLPGSGLFRMLMGAGQAYGLTEGGAHADKITATAPAKRIVKPTTKATRSPRSARRCCGRDSSASF